MKLTYRLGIFGNLLRHAVRALYAPKLEAVTCISSFVVYDENGESNKLRSDVLGVGDLRVQTAALKTTWEGVSKELKERLGVINGPPPEVLAKIKEMIAKLTGEEPADVKVYAASEDGKSGIAVAHTTPGCDCEVCRTARLETGEATPEDRARMN